MWKWSFVGKHFSPTKKFKGLLVFSSSEEVNNMSNELVFMLFSVYKFYIFKLFFRQQSLIILPHPIVHPSFISDFYKEFGERIFCE